MRIRIGTEYLDLPDDSIRYERVSDLLDFSGNTNDYSFPYTLSRTDNNDRLLGFIVNPDVFPRNYTIPCSVDLNDIDSYKAVIYINTYTNRNINITIKTGVYSLDKSDLSIKLLGYDDIDLGSDITDVRNLITAINSSDYFNEYGVCFPPFYAPNFYNGNNGDYSGVVNQFNAEASLIGYNTTTYGNRFCIAPWPFLFFILQKISDLEGLKLSGSFIDHPEMQRLLLTSNVALDAPSPDNQTLVKTSLAKTFDGVTEIVEFLKGISGTYDNLSSWNNTTFSYTFPVEGLYNIIIELPFEKTYFEAIGTAYVKVSGIGDIESSAFPAYTSNGTLSLSVSYNVTSGDVGRTIWVEVENPSISNGAIIIKDQAFFYIENSDLLGLNVFQRKFNPSICIPDITVSEFLTKVKKQFNLTWEINKTDGTFIIDFAEESVSSSIDYVDITNIVSPDFETNIENPDRDFILQFPDLDETVYRNIDESKIIGFYKSKSYFPIPLKEGDLAIDMTINRAYIASVSGTSLQWIFHTNYFTPCKTGKGILESIDIEFKPVEMCYSSNFDNSGSAVNAVMPYMPEQGTSNMFSQGTTEYDPKICFHRGMNNAQGTDDGGNYLIASTARYDINGYGIGTVDLIIQGNNGLKKKYFEQSMNISKVQEIFERSIYLGADKLIKFKKGAIYLIQNIPYVFKSISIALSNKRTGPARIKLLKIFRS